MPYPKELNRIKSIFDWRDYPDEFKNKYIDYIEDEFKRRERVSGFITRVLLLMLLVLITCTSNGQRLMLDTLTLEKQIDYSLYSGKLAKQIQDRMACVTLKTDDLVFHLWPQVKSLTLPQYHQMQDSVYYLSLVPMLKRCSQIKLYQYQSTILSFSSLYRMVWTGRRSELAYRVPASKLTRKKAYHSYQ